MPNQQKIVQTPTGNNQPLSVIFPIDPQSDFLHENQAVAHHRASQELQDIRVLTIFNNTYWSTARQEYADIYLRIYIWCYATSGNPLYNGCNIKTVVFWIYASACCNHSVSCFALMTSPTNCYDTKCSIEVSSESPRCGTATSSITCFRMLHVAFRLSRTNLGMYSFGAVRHWLWKNVRYISPLLLNAILIINITPVLTSCC